MSSRLAAAPCFCPLPAAKTTTFGEEDERAFFNHDPPSGGVGSGGKGTTK